MYIRNRVAHLSIVLEVGVTHALIVDNLLRVYNRLCRQFKHLIPASLTQSWWLLRRSASE